MTADNAGAGKDIQSITDVDTYVYETIATLEYTGRPATRSEIAAAADLDDRTLDACLTTLVDHGLVVRAGDGPAGEPAFEPDDRGWSTAPWQARGM
jgi:hypothetical protein